MASAFRRSSISPFRSRKPPPPPPSRAVTPSSLLSRQSAPPPPAKAGENVTVTVRFRPLSAREIGKGDEVAWYADGDYTVRNEFNSDISYGFDKVFGLATTTRQVYDVAAHHVVNGAMEGINGTVFAYGVTSSGKTHTMHGEQKSPGIIPQAIKDVFGIIQETPGREFLLRVSYLEIYNEVINDLLNPTGQNLRIREDSQGTFVEGIKEEVVLSPAHALSLIASGEEHRHVGSNNFNLLSSRSHTIFTLTVESNLRGDIEGEEVTLSQLDLTTGLRRKEGSYINKSLLTLGTVISKLTDGKSSHVPYRDSKLTRLLQSSLSGHGRVSLICTVTPATSNTEETHNTLKFSQRSKHVEIKASQNKILDEKSLIKKYQREISILKQELQQLKSGMTDKENQTAPSQEDLVNLKLQLEESKIKLQSRLEEEEQAKAALMGRIQRLTKLILVSTKTTIQPNTVEKTSHWRRHSFAEDELAYLPDRKRESITDDAGSIDSEISNDGRSDTANIDDLVRDYKKNRRRGMLNWFKVKKPENVLGTSLNTGRENSASGSSISRKVEDAARVGSFPDRTQAGDLFSAAIGLQCLPPTGSTITDQMDLFHEQIEMLAGEVAFSTSSLKRLSEHVAKGPGDSYLLENVQKLKDEIREKKHQIRVLEQRVIGSVETSPYGSSNVETSQTMEATEMQETITLLSQQPDSLMSNKDSSEDSSTTRDNSYGDSFDINNGRGYDLINSCDELSLDKNTPTSFGSLNRSIFNHENSKECICGAFTKSQLLAQAAEIESLKQDKVRLVEDKNGLEIHCQKQTEEASYAKELAAAAAVELRNLAEEVTKLSYQNAKLTADLAAGTDTCCKPNFFQKYAPVDMRQNVVSGSQSDPCSRNKQDRLSMEELEQELCARHQREASLVAALSERDKVEADLRKRLDEAKRHEEKLENELANMWVLVANMRKSTTGSDETRQLNGVLPFPDGQSLTKFHENEESEIAEDACLFDDLKVRYQSERRKFKHLDDLNMRSKVSGHYFGLLPQKFLDTH
ncbi:kinesin-like protein KIN-7C, mitochondrial isoform X2 [Salvia divinorum]|uniref:Kinesin-like protein KIN-7C, mitochondrial isoform X2 n=1 Tax=Salvia divinorum TaxID=28513 RepID=A0ABD1HKV5_SALDI